MTETDLREALAHPMLRSLVHRLVDAQVAIRMAEFKLEVAQMIDDLHHKPKVVPEGWLTYAEAVAKHGYTLQTVRTHVCKKYFKGKNGIVQEASIIAYKASKVLSKQHRHDDAREQRAR